jgi:c-di-GMP-binding flagellar brake protein YcgR
MNKQHTQPQDENFVIKQPLQLYKERKRRFVRLEIAAPVTYGILNIDRPLDEALQNQHNGTILNISGGGVLMVGDTSLTEGTYVTMSFELSGSDLITGIAGKVKRVDEDGEGGYLVGVEFCSETELQSVFGHANIGSVISSFDTKVKRFLLKYIFARKVQERLEQSEDEK